MMMGEKGGFEREIRSCQRGLVWEREIIFLVETAASGAYECG